MRAVWSQMRKQGYGRVLNESSNSSFGIDGNAPYSTTKSGLLGLTMDAAIEGKPHGSLVNAIMPTAFTRMIEQIPDPVFVDWFRRCFPAHRAADAALYLLGSWSQCTGLIWAVGGGRAARVAFAEGRGCLNVDSLPDGLDGHLDQVNDMRAATVLNSQAESMAFLNSLLTADGESSPSLSLDAVLGSNREKP